MATGERTQRGIGELGLALLVVATVALLIVPLPPWLLDLLLTANIALALVLLLVSLYIQHPLRLSTFPSILLVATLFRLALNVSSTRLILGQAYAGEVIESFGRFVVGGNYVVGAVIFLILTIVQFVVIAKGSERVAEVAARFTLDAMPGKQMAIDADLRAGAFTIADARRMRQELQSESHLYGAMKFVKGDAIAGISITLINIVGGLVIGTLQRGMGLADAAQTYTLLTVGDGLVSQIPALLVAFCSGVIVTRVSSRDDDPVDLGTEIAGQLTDRPRVFGIAALLLGFFALVPGLPAPPFLALSLFAGLGAWRLDHAQREARRRDREAGVEPAPAGPSDEPSRWTPLVTPIQLDVGAELSERLRGASDSDALQQEIRTARDVFFERLGVRLPAVRVRFGSGDVAPHALRVSVHGVAEPSVEVPPRRVLALAPPATLVSHGVQAVEAQHPVTGAACGWIDEADATRLDGQVTVIEPVGVSMLHVLAAARRRASDLVGIAEVQAALDAIEGSHGALVEAVVPRPLSVARLTGALRRLVDEDVSIRDLRGILEALAAEATEETDAVTLAEIARVGVGRATCTRVAPDRRLRAYSVAHDIEETVRDAISRHTDPPVLALPPRATSELLDAFRRALTGTSAAAVDAPIIVCSQDVRRYLAMLVRLERPDATVIGLREVPDDVHVETVGHVSVARG